MQDFADSFATENQGQTESRGALSPDSEVAYKREEGPPIDSLLNLKCWGEKFGYENGTKEFKCSYAIYLDENEMSYYGETYIRKSDLNPQVLTEYLKRIPDEELYPEKPRGLNICSFQNTDGLHVKEIIHSWNDRWKGTDYLPGLFLGEIEAFQLLHRNPHPNIVRYHGCKVNRRGRVVGIVMDRHEKTLAQYLDNKPGDFNIYRCYEEIRRAIEHLHSLGIAHNDLTPHNIMLDKNQSPILINFASCKPIREKLIEGSAYRWIEEGKIYRYSKKEHDESALNKIFDWMREKERY